MFLKMFVEEVKMTKKILENSDNLFFLYIIIFMVGIVVFILVDSPMFHLFHPLTTIVSGLSVILAYLFIQNRLFSPTLKKERFGRKESMSIKLFFQKIALSLSLIKPPKTPSPEEAVANNFKKCIETRGLITAVDRFQNELRDSPLWQKLTVNQWIEVADKNLSSINNNLYEKLANDVTIYKLAIETIDKFIFTFEEWNTIKNNCSLCAILDVAIDKMFKLAQTIDQVLILDHIDASSCSKSYHVQMQIILEKIIDRPYLSHERLIALYKGCQGKLSELLWKKITELRLSFDEWLDIYYHSKYALRKLALERLDETGNDFDIWLSHFISDFDILCFTEKFYLALKKIQNLPQTFQQSENLYNEVRNSYKKINNPVCEGDRCKKCEIRQKCVNLRKQTGKISIMLQGLADKKMHESTKNL